MLETIRTAVQCLKLARFSSRSVPASGTVTPSENSIKDKTNELEGSLTSESNDEVDSDDGEELIDCKTDVSFKDLFRMATLGGATGTIPLMYWLVLCIMRSAITSVITLLVLLLNDKLTCNLTFFHRYH